MTLAAGSVGLGSFPWFLHSCIPAFLEVITLGRVPWSGAAPGRVVQRPRLGPRGSASLIRFKSNSFPFIVANLSIWSFVSDSVIFASCYLINSITFSIPSAPPPWPCRTINSTLFARYSSVIEVNLSCCSLVMTSAWMTAPWQCHSRTGQADRFWQSGSVLQRMSKQTHLSQSRDRRRPIHNRFASCGVRTRRVD